MIITETSTHKSLICVLAKFRRQFMNFAVVFEFCLADLNFGFVIVGILSGWDLWPLNLAAGVVCFFAGLTDLDK